MMIQSKNMIFRLENQLLDTEEEEDEKEEEYAPVSEGKIAIEDEIKSKYYPNSIFLYRVFDIKFPLLPILR